MIDYDAVLDDHEGHPALFYEGRMVADFDQLLDAYEDSVASHKATLRLFTKYAAALQEAAKEDCVSDWHRNCGSCASCIARTALGLEEGAAA